MISAKDFGAVGDGVTDDTKAIQAWASQTDVRILGDGTYLVSEPIVFAAGGEVLGYNGTLKLSDGFSGRSVWVCHGIPYKPTLIEGFAVDMNKQNVWLASQKESSWVTINNNIVRNTHSDDVGTIFDVEMDFYQEVAI